MPLRAATAIELIQGVDPGANSSALCGIGTTGWRGPDKSQTSSEQSEALLWLHCLCGLQIQSVQRCNTLWKLISLAGGF